MGVQGERRPTVSGQVNGALVPELGFDHVHPSAVRRGLVAELSLQVPAQITSTCPGAFVTAGRFSFEWAHAVECRDRWLNLYGSNAGK